MTDVQTAGTDAAEVEEDSSLSPAEVAWWNTRRELAYHAISSGTVQTHLARALGVSYPTLYLWRHHPYWEARAAREQQARARAHAVAVCGLDEVAVASLRTHLEKSPPVALRYALARGLLAFCPETTPAADAWLDLARQAAQEANQTPPAPADGRTERSGNEKPSGTSNPLQDAPGGA